MINGYGVLIQAANPFGAQDGRTGDDSTTVFGNYQDREEEEREPVKTPIRS